MPGVDKEPRTVKTADTLFGIIELLDDMEGATLREVADRLGVAKSTAYTHLITLEEKGYIVKDGEQYKNSLKLLHIGERVRRRRKDYQLAQEYVEKLAEMTEYRAHYITEEHGRGVYLYSKTGENGVKAKSEIAQTFPLHAGASGKVILAFLPEERTEEILKEHGLPQLTSNTITTKEELLDELEQTRRSGVGFSDEELVEGFRSVAAPVREDQNEILGALCVSGPINWLDDELFQSELPDLLRGTANELELTISHS